MISRRQYLKTGSTLLALLGSSFASAKAATAPGSQDIPQYDVVVVGAGTGGLVTAIQAHDLGLKPIIVEKMECPAGNTIYAMGSFAAFGTNLQNEAGVKDSKEAFYRDFMKVSEERADPELVQVYVDNISEAVNWLQNDLGIAFKPLKKGVFSRWPAVDGKGITGGGQLIRSLVREAEKRKIPFLFNAKVNNLLTNERGHVIGVVAQADDGIKTIHAKDGVVIATGGFSGNSEMLNTYMGGTLSRLCLRGSPYVTGENVTLTRPLGARLVNMDQFHCGPIVANTHLNPNIVINSGTGFEIDENGKRFVDENSVYTAKCRTTVLKTRRNMGWHIMSSNCERTKAAVEKYKKLNTVFYEGNTPEELAQKLGIDPKAFTELFNAYNQAVKDNTLKNWEPPCTLKNPVELTEAPFYAFPFQGGITATFGGPKINTNAQIINNEGRPIRGLYAVGNAAGGLFFANYIGGAQLGGATVFGRKAAAHMASHHSH